MTVLLAAGGFALGVAACILEARSTRRERQRAESAISLYLASRVANRLLREERDRYQRLAYHPTVREVIEEADEEPVQIADWIH